MTDLLRRMLCKDGPPASPESGAVSPQPSRTLGRGRCVPNPGLPHRTDERWRPQHPVCESARKRPASERGEHDNAILLHASRPLRPPTSPWESTVASPQDERQHGLQGRGPMASARVPTRLAALRRAANRFGLGVAHLRGVLGIDAHHEVLKLTLPLMPRRIAASEPRRLVDWLVRHPRPPWTAHPEKEGSRGSLDNWLRSHYCTRRVQMP